MDIVGLLGGLWATF
jgi:hypothetical protein